MQEGLDESLIILDAWWRRPLRTYVMGAATHAHGQTNFVHRLLLATFVNPSSSSCTGRPVRYGPPAYGMDLYRNRSITCSHVSNRGDRGTERCIAQNIPFGRAGIWCLFVVFSHVIWYFFVTVYGDFLLYIYLYMYIYVNMCVCPTKYRRYSCIYIQQFCV